MSLIIRPADLERDTLAIIKLLAAHLNPAYDQARLDWLYRQNPAGHARAWVLENRATGEVVGAGAAIPRWMFVDGNRERALILSDFCVAPSVRTLGPALQLQRACLSPVTAGEFAFSYDFPSHGMMAIYARLGLTAVGTMRRYVRPLRVDDKVRALVPAALLARGLSAAGNSVLAWATAVRPEFRGLEVAPHAGRCLSEFTALAETARHRHRVCVNRTAEYMNWRFLDNPFQSHEIVSARRHGILVAYAVVTTDQESPTIVDVFGPSDAATMGALVRGTVAILGGRGAHRVSLCILDSHPWGDTLSRLGFRQRDTSPALVYAPDPRSPIATVPPTGWLLTQGDRDS